VGGLTQAWARYADSYHTRLPTFLQDVDTCGIEVPIFKFLSFIIYQENKLPRYWLCRRIWKINFRRKKSCDGKLDTIPPRRVFSPTSARRSRMIKWVLAIQEGRKIAVQKSGDFWGRLSG
jgi:hypothetical protein